MGDVLSILRLLGIVLSGIFGVLGLLTEFKDKDTGNVTRWGRIALAGIGLSTIIALAAGVLEARKAASDAREAERQTRLQLEHSNKILADLRRTLDPLTNIRVSYELKFPLNSVQFARYRRRLERGLKALLATPSQSRTRQGVVILPPPAEGKPELVRISRRSPLRPQPEDGIPYYVVGMPEVDFEFFLTPPPPRTFTMADFVISIGEGFPKAEQGGPSYALQYDLAKRELTLDVSNLSSVPQSLFGTGKIKSASDLGGTHLFVTFVLPFPGHTMHSDLARDDAETREFNEVVKQIELKRMEVAINTRVFDLTSVRSGRRLVETSRIRRMSGETTYTMVIPDDIDELQWR